MTSLLGAIRRPHAALAGSVAVVVLASVVVSVAAVVSLRLPLSDLLLWPAIAAFAGAGWLLAVRVPENRIGWLLLMTAVGFNFLPWTVISSWLLVHHIPGGRFEAGVSQSAFVLDVGGLAMLIPLFFPDGRLPSGSRRWRVVLAADLAYMVLASANVFAVGTADMPGYGKLANPFAITGARHVVNALIAMSAPLFLIGVVGSMGALVVRWRSAEPARRAQMKWVLGALLLAPIPFALHDWWTAGSDTAMSIVLPIVPTAIAVSVLRYRLYDIDRILSRAVAYVLVTGVLVGVYVGLVAMTTSLLSFGGSARVAASTLAAAAMFHPVRRRVQRAVDRRFNRQRYDAGRIVDRFAVRLRDAVDPDLVRSDLLAVTATTVQPASLSLWVVT